MNDQIEELEKLLAQNQAEKARSPYLEVAAGALTTAIANWKQHLVEMTRRADLAKAPGNAKV